MYLTLGRGRKRRRAYASPRLASPRLASASPALYLDPVLRPLLDPTSSWTPYNHAPPKTNPIRRRRMPKAGAYRTASRRRRLVPDLKSRGCRAYTVPHLREDRHMQSIACYHAQHLQSMCWAHPPLVPHPDGLPMHIRIGLTSRAGDAQHTLYLTSEQRMRSIHCTSDRGCVA